MKKIRIWFITTCISFTLVILVQTVLGGSYLNDKYIIEHDGLVMFECKSIENSFIILIISTIIYFICCGIVYIKNSDDARKINEKIKRYRS